MKRQLHQHSTEFHSPTFPVICLEETKALDVFIDFMLKNQPCRMHTKTIAKWKSRQQWVKCINGKNIVNIEFFIKHYGKFFLNKTIN